MDSRETHAYVQRDWQDAAGSKATYWADCFRQDWRTTWNAAQSLLTHARLVRSPFPTDQERDLDFGAHLSLLAQLDRAAHAFVRR